MGRVSRWSIAGIVLVGCASWLAIRRFAREPADDFGPTRPQTSAISSVKSVRTPDFARESPDDFPAFRGRAGAATIAQRKFAEDWKAHPPRLLWKYRPGGGLSSFTVVGDFCITQEQDGDDELVVCREVRTGAECWTHRYPARFYEMHGGAGPRATAAIYDGCVYALGATGQLHCLDGRDGSVRWKVDTVADNEASLPLFGAVASPLIVDGAVAVAVGCRGEVALAPDLEEGRIVTPTVRTRGRALVAYDARTGERRWTGGDGTPSYSSPTADVLAGVEVLLCFHGDGLTVHRRTDGKPLANLPWVSNPPEKNNVCQPLVVPRGPWCEYDAVFLSAGYGMGCALYAAVPKGDGLELQMRWKTNALNAKFTSVVFRNGFVYGLDERILCCVDVRTGKRAWKGGRYGHGQILLVDEYILVQAEDGMVALVEARPDRYAETTRFRALEGRVWNAPALAGRLLLVRSENEAACWELPERGAGE